MGLFDTDPILTSTTPAAPAAPATGASCPNESDNCRDPGRGNPRFDLVVLNNLYADGRITRAAYRAVKAGTKSIEDLDITPAQLARLRCDGPGETGLYDEHFDPGFPPRITPSAAVTISADFTAGHLPTDKTHKITVNVPAGSSLASGDLVARVDFGTQYVDEESGLEAAPVVTVSAVGGSSTWRVGSITSTGYYLYTDSGLAATSTTNLQVLVEPTRR